jgi:hypothetical protein
MIDGLEMICKEFNYKDDDLFKVAKKLSEHELSSSHVSAIMILCRLNKCTETIHHRYISDQVERNHRDLDATDEKRFPYCALSCGYQFEGIRRMTQVLAQRNTEPAK